MAMEKNTTTTTTDPNPPSSSNCEECSENPWKYKCPGCSIRTCSLTCVKAHKHRTSCTGQKDRSAVVPLSKFDDALLLSDYNFLEDAKRVAEAARRGRRGKGGNFNSNFNFNFNLNSNCTGRLPKPLHWLRGAAYRRKTTLRVLPDGMSKRVNNRSWFDRRLNSILWTIEWRFHKTNVVLMDHRVSECTNICSAIEKHLIPSPWNHQLKPFCDEHVENLKFLLQKNPAGPKLLFRELDPRIPLGKQMADTVIVEYPVIYVYLPSHSYDFEVEKYVEPFSSNAKYVEKCAEPFSSNAKYTAKPENISSPKGITFKEEEIEDDGASETQVLDLTKHMEIDAPINIEKYKENEISDKFSPSDINTKSTGFAFIDSFSKDENQLDHKPDVSQRNDTESETIGCGFDFKQELKDAYSDLLGEINPDDFLCFGGLHGDEDDCLDTILDLHDELEEGEILC